MNGSRGPSGPLFTEGGIAVPARPERPFETGHEPPLNVVEAEKRIAAFFRGSTRVRQGIDVDCPFCGAAMIVRARGRDGRTFLGCMKYPNCSGTLDIPDAVQEESKKWERQLMTSQHASSHLDAERRAMSARDVGKFWPDFGKSLDKRKEKPMSQTEAASDAPASGITARLKRSAAKAPYRLARMRALTNGKAALLNAARGRVKPATFDIIEAFLDTDAGQGAIIGVIGLAGPMTPKLGKNKHVQALCDEFLDEGVAKGFNQVLSLVAMIVEPALESAIREMPGVDAIADKVVPKRKKKRVATTTPEARVAREPHPEIQDDVEEEESRARPLRAVASR